jgi:adenylate cyclase
MLARISVHLPLAPVRSVLVFGDREHLIGRDPDCDVVFDDDRVSRQHARLTWDGSTWRIADLSSKNGTSVDGRPIQEAELKGGAWIGFGGLIARFEPTTEEKERALAADRERRWRTSLSLQRGLSPVLGLPALLARILESVLRVAASTRGFVLLRDRGGSMEVAVSRGLTPDELASPLAVGSSGAVQRAIETVKPVAVSDALGDPFLGSRDSVAAGGIRALVCLPLTAGHRLLGVVYADSSTPGAGFTELDVEILEGLASQAGLAIAVALLDREIDSVAGKVRPRGGEDDR